jgi:hypothetical protein
MSNLYSFRCGLIPNQLAGDPDSRFLNVEKSSACCSNDKRTVHTVAADSKVAEAASFSCERKESFTQINARTVDQRASTRTLVCRVPID